MKYKIEIETFSTYILEITNIPNGVIDIVNFTWDDADEIIESDWPGDTLFTLGIPLNLKWFYEDHGEFRLKVKDKSGKIVCKENNILKLFSESDEEFEEVLKANFKDYDYHFLKEPEYCIVKSSWEKANKATYYIELDEPFDITKLRFAEMREYNELFPDTKWTSIFHLFYDKKHLEVDDYDVPYYSLDTALLCMKIGEGYNGSNFIGLKEIVYSETDANSDTLPYISLPDMEYKDSNNKNSKPINEKGENSNNTIQGHEYVDLGLSVKWATCNVGASQSHEYGNYYAYSKTHTKDKSTKDDNQTYNTSMDDISGNPGYNVVTANWGDLWRLPTNEEIDELINKCTWQWMKQNDVNGFKVTGPNGNSIFLPAAGHYNEASPCNVGKKGYYLTSSSSNLLYLSRAYRFISSGNYISLDWHQDEYTIRPVSD